MERFSKRGQLEIICYTIAELITTDEHEFCKTLYEHTEEIELDENVYIDALNQVNGGASYYITDDDDPVNKIRSWLDCIRFIKRMVPDERIDDIGNVHIGFEYRLKKRWVDAIIVCKEKLIILEFKSGKSDDAESIRGYIKQLRRYNNRIRRGNSEVVKRFNSGNLKIEKFLVFTNPYMKGKTPEDSSIVVRDEFSKVIDAISQPTDITDLAKILDNTKFIDPSISGALTSLIKHGIVDYVEKNNDNVQACDKILHEILENEKLTLGITLVKGGPGTGKTGTAFTLLERCLSEGITSVQYVTGNGNLERYFTGIVEGEIERLKTNSSTNTIFNTLIRDGKFDDLEGLGEQLIGHINELYDAENYCNKYYYNRGVELTHIDDQVLLVDEAQRMWNALNIATRTKKVRGEYMPVFADELQQFIYGNNLSEAYLLLYSAIQGILRDNKNKNIVMFLGNGQEINSGEEDGEKDVLNSIFLITKLIDNEKLPISLKVYASDCDVRDTFQKYNVACEYRPELELVSNQRNDLGDPGLDIVKAILDGETNNVGAQTGYEIYDNYNELLKAVAYDPAATYSSDDESIGIIVNSYDNDPSNKGKYSFMGENLKDAGNDLYNFFYLRNSNKLDAFVSEFGCQGLEFDDSILIWGRTLIWRDGKWVVNPEGFDAVSRYGKPYNRSRYIRLKMYVKTVNELISKVGKAKTKPLDEKTVIEQFVKNAYRVLLTRARETTYIYVEDSETYRHLKQLLG